jgi:2'-5' RNA ligase
MDASDVQESEGVMIALLPTSADWCKIDLPHLTLVYAGSKNDLRPTDFSELAKDTAMLAQLSSPLGLQVMSKDRFGDAGDTDVFKLQPSTQLWAMRRAVERWNKSSYPFNPHVTIGPAGTFVEVVPRYIRFDRMMLAWGTDQLTFWLGRGGY